MNTIKIDPKFKLENVAAHPDMLRPNIQNIKLAKSENFGNVAIATNGRAMAIVPIEVSEGENDQGLVTTEALKASRKNKSLAGTMNLNSKIELPGTVIFPRPVESDDDLGKFAYGKWHKAIPDRSEHKYSIALNPQFLLDLAKAIGTEKQGVRLMFGEAHDPILVKPYNVDDKAVGVLMPMRLPQ